MAKSVRILRSYNLDPQQVDFLKALAFFTDKSKSQLVRDAIDLLIKKSMDDGLSDKVDQYLSNDKEEESGMFGRAVEMKTPE